MRIRLLKSIGAPIVLVSIALFLSPTQPTAQDNAQDKTSTTASVKASAASQVPVTPWGEPDLQGIWTVEFDTPLQRPAKYANQEFFSQAQREELDKERSALLGRDKRVQRGTELDVAGAYNAVFMSKKRTGARTSLIVEPPNGRLPPLTQEAEKNAAAEREFRLVLLQATETCKARSVACSGG